MRRSIATVTAVIALAAPAAAFAQSAGDEQYQDPLAGSNQSQSNSGSGSGSSGSSGQGSSGSTSSQGSSSTGTGQSSSSSSSGSSGSPELARTGFPVGLPIAAGALLLLGGVGLRRVALRGER